MRLSAKIRYAIRTLVEIGKSPGKVIPLTEVEKNQKISAKFAKQILQPLERSNIVGSKRGARGGYFLKKNPADIRLMDVISAFDIKINVVPCLKNPGQCKREDVCGAKIKWDELNQIINNFFIHSTIQDMIDKEKN